MPAVYVDTRSVPLDELTPFPGNAKRGDVDSIRTSLRRNGQYRSLVVRQVEHGALIVLAGNHTMQALAAEGSQTARCEIVTCDDAEARRINLADNRLAEMGGYDNDALTELLSYLDGDYDGTGYNQDDIDALLGDVEELAPVVGDPDDVPDAPDEPVSKPGDVWILGPHRLMCGDSTNPDDLAKLTGNLEPTLVYTDPPYGIAIVSGGKVGGDAPFGSKKAAAASKKPAKVIASSDYIPVAGDDTTVAAADVFHFLMAAYPDAKHVWWGGNHYAASAGLPDSSCWLVWDKENTGNFADAELAWTNHPGAVRVLRHMWNGMLRASERGKRVHPTQKPVALAEWAFTVVDAEHTREVVLDVFGGSGSTLIACHTTGRTGLLMEMEPAYIDVICRRYQQTTGEQPILEATGEAHDFTQPAE